MRKSNALSRSAFAIAEGGIFFLSSSQAALFLPLVMSLSYNGAIGLILSGLRIVLSGAKLLTTDCFNLFVITPVVYY